jgi:hypothetical protein
LHGILIFFFFFPPSVSAQFFFLIAKVGAAKVWEFFEGWRMWGC